MVLSILVLSNREEDMCYNIPDHNRALSEYSRIHDRRGEIDPFNNKHLRFLLTHEAVHRSSNIHKFTNDEEEAAQILRQGKADALFVYKLLGSERAIQETDGLVVLVTDRQEGIAKEIFPSRNHTIMSSMMDLTDAVRLGEDIAKDQTSYLASKGLRISSEDALLNRSHRPTPEPFSASDVAF